MNRETSIFVQAGLTPVKSSPCARAASLAPPGPLGNSCRRPCSDVCRLASASAFPRSLCSNSGISVLLQLETATQVSSMNQVSPMDDAVWIGFVGQCDLHATDAVREFEDDVLALLPRHGAEVVVRARRADGQGVDLPAELQILRFPSRDAFNAFMEDPDRLRVQKHHGDPFTSKAVVELARPFFGAAASG